MSVLLGQCHCGTCCFEVPVESVRFGFASCHCSICRGCNSSPFTQWSGMDAAKSTDFVVRAVAGSMTAYRSSSCCVRHFCSTCGAHVYIRYDSINSEASTEGQSSSQWADEIHFPTALLNNQSIELLETAMAAKGKPRYLHVYYSDRTPSLGNLELWVQAPKYGGTSGLEPINE